MCAPSATTSGLHLSCLSTLVQPSPNLRWPLPTLSFNIETSFVYQPRINWFPISAECLASIGLSQPAIDYYLRRNITDLAMVLNHLPAECKVLALAGAGSVGIQRP